MTKVLILGAGAVGGYFGGRLAEIGHDVTFLVRHKRKEIMAQHGLRIKSPAGDVTLQAKTLDKEELQRQINNNGLLFDYVFLTSKAYDLDQAIDSIRPAMGETTVLIPALNGMAHLEKLNHEFGKNNVMAGCVVIQSTLTGDGVIQHLNDEALGFFGAQAGGIDKRATIFAKLFDRAKGVKVAAVEDALQRMWNKWVRLATLAGMTCLMRANVGEICRAPGGEKAMVNLLTANNSIATAAGYPLTSNQLKDTENFLTNHESLATASMLRDIEQGHLTEGDHILGDLLKRAQYYGIDNPILSLCYTHVKAYEQRRMSERDKR